jgi:hypothetical protein
MRMKASGAAPWRHAGNYALRPPPSQAMGGGVPRRPRAGGGRRGRASSRRRGRPATSTTRRRTRRSLPTAARRPRQARAFSCHGRAHRRPPFFRQASSEGKWIGRSVHPSGNYPAGVLLRSASTLTRPPRTTDRQRAVARNGGLRPSYARVVRRSRIRAGPDRPRLRRGENEVDVTRLDEPNRQPAHRSAPCRAGGTEGSAARILPVAAPLWLHAPAARALRMEAMT